MKTYKGEHYDIIVIGAGHAGVEAALASARLGYSTLVLTLNIDGIALMACNPSIGGTAKGHLVKEIDALGGEMGLAADATFLQIKMLNSSKGPAVHSLRAQIDKRRYHEYMKRALERTENLYIKQDEAEQIIVEGSTIKGLITAQGAELSCKAIIIATGVYLKSNVIIGEFTRKSGPSGLMGAYGLSKSLLDLGFRLQRFKTGTPARVDARSLDFSKMEPQYGDERIVPFSFMSSKIIREQVPCYLTYTNERTHEIIRNNISRSPLYSGVIQGTGPRYCPSIEDKVVKFPDKERHQLFIEPEGSNTVEMYVQGMSSSLPEEVQVALYRTVPGMEKVHFMRTAYAIEYDCIDPTQLKNNLEAKEVKGLFFAGQINGSSGYEEAAAQGIIAGINAVQYLREQDAVVLGRDTAYIGVLVDDLVTKGTKEPYRMMTARAEYRLILRQDNADERLTEIGRKIGLVSDSRYERFIERRKNIKEEIEKLNKTFVKPSKNVNDFLGGIGETEITESVSAADLIRRPKISVHDLEPFTDTGDYSEDVKESAQTEIKYEGYIVKQKQQISRFRELENKKLPQTIDYMSISGLRIEARQKLNMIKPENLGQASRISGVSPADIAVLLIFLKGQENGR